MKSDDIVAKLQELGVLSDRQHNLGFIDSGSFALNKIISGKYAKGGYPIGKIIEIFGENSTGKTVFLTHAIAAAQKKGYFTVLLDNEFTYNRFFAESLGVDSTKLIYDDPPTVSQCFSRIEELILKIREFDTDTPILIGLDSLAGQSDAEEEKKIDELTNTDGMIRAKEIGQCLRKINPMLRINKACLIVINQVRMNPLVMYGDKTAKSGGGKALEFWSSVSLKTKSNKTSDLIKDDKDRVIGIQGVVENKKNKEALPFQQCPFKLIYDKGLDPYWGLEAVAIEAGLVTKSGAGWYTVKSTGAKFQGEEALQSFISTSQDVQNYLINN